MYPHLIIKTNMYLSSYVVDYSTEADCYKL